MNDVNETKEGPTIRSKCRIRLLFENLLRALTNKSITTIYFLNKDSNSYKTNEIKNNTNYRMSHFDFYCFIDILLLIQTLIQVVAIKNVYKRIENFRRNIIEN